MADDKLVEGIRKALDGAKPRKFKESVEICINLKDVDLAIRSVGNKPGGVPDVIHASLMPWE